jgi:heat shock protein HslJ
MGKAFDRAVVAVLALLAATPAVAQTRAGPPPRIGDELEGTSWQAKSLNGQAVADPSAMTIDFLPGGDQVRGQAGCNRFVGPFASRADKVTMGILRQSRTKCPPELAAVQKALIDMLHAAWQAKIEDGVLTFTSRQGEQITFVRRPRS